MQGVKEYLIGVIAAAIVCAIISQMIGKGSFLSAALKLATGVFMLIALVAPALNLRIRPTKIFSDISVQAEQITSSAENSTRESICRIIKDRTQTYILDKAKSQGADLTVDITLSDAEIPAPVSVEISGDVSPYTKKILSEMIEKDLGISAEAQIWK